MCLIETKPIEIEEGEGYVCVVKNSSYVRALFGPEEYELNKWYTARRIDGLREEAPSNWIPGFHIFETLDDAKEYEMQWFHMNKIIAKCRYKNAIERGLSLVYENKSIPAIKATERMLTELLGDK